ncbi:MAG TPA: hypothetical protein DCL15_20665 [Chloroflexi bacterium]|nr:hypothetical protein [Chloroflexota bacterium]HHW85546.1 zinc ribbon domain-containing protein [Chloroflexota bacterium]
MGATLCPHCGTPNRTGANFCNRCGADLRGETPPPVDPAVGAAPEAPGDAASESASPAQPWLAPGFLGADDAPYADDEEDLAALDALPPLPAPAARLVSGVQGLLDPIRVAVMPQDDAPTSDAAGAPELPFSAEQLRRVRALLVEDPMLAPGPALRPAPARSLWLPVLFLSFGLSVALLLGSGWPLPAGAPMLWQGVDRGFAAVDHLQQGARVQLLWAYDPATAGEMELVTAPVLRHLLARDVTLDVVSLLPNGPATARRVFAAVEAERLPDLSAIGVHRTLAVRFLPGGVTVLPLLSAERADLAVIFGAQAEDVQQWLEQVAPVNRAPVLAVTSAGADPPLRPFLDSGQLVGLVSGYDGAYHYYELLGETPPAAVRSLRTQLVGQGYGALALLAIIVLGNLAALLTGRRQDG